jgi:hypothetical protein
MSKRKKAESSSEEDEESSSGSEGSFGSNPELTSEQKKRLGKLEDVNNACIHVKRGLSAFCGLARTARNKQVHKVCKEVYSLARPKLALDSNVKALSDEFGFDFGDETFQFSDKSVGSVISDLHKLETCTCTSAEKKRLGGLHALMIKLEGMQGAPRDVDDLLVGFLNRLSDAHAEARSTFKTVPSDECVQADTDAWCKASAKAWGKLKLQFDGFMDSASECTASYGTSAHAEEVAEAREKEMEAREKEWDEKFKAWAEEAAFKQDFLGADPFHGIKIRGCNHA